MPHHDHLTSERLFQTMPSLGEWKRKSFVGDIFKPKRADDALLLTIDRTVERFHQTVPPDARVNRLCELFHLCMHWVRSHKHNHKMDPRRRGPILSLQNVVMRTLAGSAGDRQVHALLKKNIATEMCAEGAATDAKEGAVYLTPAERDYIQVFFMSGLTYRATFSAEVVRLTPFDTRGSYMPERTGNANGIAGRGFVMSPSGDLYALDLKGTKGFHSCLLGGRPVLCAGSIQADMGRIVSIRNDSGHYRPDERALVLVLHHLMAKHINLRGIQVISQARYMRDKDHSITSATELLHAGGDWSRVKRFDREPIDVV